MAVRIAGEKPTVGYNDRLSNLLPGIEREPEYYMPYGFAQVIVLEPKKPEHKVWWEELNDRETEEVRFATLYAEEFNHGTDGHSRLMLIAKLVKLLDERDEN